MDDIETLKDYLIADEILRIQSLSREKLEKELIEIKSKEIELFNDLISIRIHYEK
jgi:hypothetical protein